jgi:hypothetical protein
MIVSDHGKELTSWVESYNGDRPHTELRYEFAAAFVAKMAAVTRNKALKL